MRTGTTWLSTLLDSHPSIDCDHELLHRMKYRGRAIDAKEYLDRCLFESSSASVRGFKVMYHQMRGPKSISCHIFSHLFRETYDCKVIHMLRNKLDVYVSHCLGTQSKLWNILPDKQQVVAKTGRMYNCGNATFEDCVEKYNKPVVIDIEHLKMFYKKYAIWENKIKEIFPDHIEVHYEDLPNVSEILQYLEVNDAPLQAGTQKLRQFSNKELIINYDEVMSVIPNYSAT